MSGLKLFGVIGLVFGLAISSIAQAHAAASRQNTGATSGRDKSLVYGQQAVEAGEWQKAVKLLERAVKLNPTNADAFNLLAYSYRRNGQLDPAFANYEKALQLEPKHKGAHEYIGEAFLMVGEIGKAEEQLAILEDLCGSACDETQRLSEAIARYKNGGEEQAALDDEDDLW